MSRIFAIDRLGPGPASEAETRPAVASSLATFGAWMVGLGAIRMIGELFASIVHYQEAQAAGLNAGQGWLGPLINDPPTNVVIYTWPMALGIWIWYSRTRELVRAAALTLLILSIGGALATLADWNPGAGSHFPLGSFRLPKHGWDHFSMITWAAAVAGATQLATELMLAIVALWLAGRGVGETAGAGLVPTETGTRSQAGRLALYATAAFLALTLRLPASSVFVEMLAHSPTIRAFLLRDDFARIQAAARRAPRSVSNWVVHARTLLDDGERAWYEHKYPESAAIYRKLVAQIEATPTASMDALERRFVGQVLNNWAWFLATCPREELRDREAAVKYAQQSLDLGPNEAATWNTLGVAYFRLEAWDEALSAFYRSMDLSDEGSSADWFFLAMIHKRLGHEARAIEWYNKATRAITAGDPQQYDELYRFETEAAALLGLPKPEPPRAPVFRRYPGRRSSSNNAYPGRHSRGEYIPWPGPTVDAPRSGDWPSMIPGPVY